MGKILLLHVILENAIDDMISSKCLMDIDRPNLMLVFDSHYYFHDDLIELEYDYNILKPLINHA